MVDAVVRQNQNLAAQIRQAGDVIVPVRAALGAPVAVEDLTNVTIPGKENNATLVYTESTQKYEVKKLNLDGGTF